MTDAQRSNSFFRLLKQISIFLIVILALSALALTAAAYLSEDVSWRVKVLKYKLSGDIPEIPFTTLLRWMRPGSDVYLGDLAHSPNVNASITNLHGDAKSAEAGARVYGRVCIECHGDNAAGRTGPDLTAAVSNMTDWTFFSTVKHGRPGTIMMPQPLSDLEIWQVHAFVRKLSIDAATGRKSRDANSAPLSPVTPENLLAAQPSDEWLMYAGNYAAYRHSQLNQVTRGNVDRLSLAWAAQLPSNQNSLESTPIISNGRMFVTESPEGLTALDARNGAVLWQFHRAVPPNIPLCCGAQNRGVAILGNSLFLETLDAHLIALDAATGKVLWDDTVGDWQAGYSMTATPLAIDDRIVVGIAGGDFGIRGFVAAFSAKTGEQQWKFYVVPGPGEPGNETWGGDSWKHGGVGTWTTGAYDPALGLVYWGTGNPDPVYKPEGRPGTNLYASSVVALDARTGKLRWYYQFTPSDAHDWDATQQPVLADIPWNGGTEQVLLEANRNGFFYELNRQTGKFLRAKPFAKQTWNDGFTPEGNPIVRPNSNPTRLGAIVSPAAGGATNWWPPSYDSRRKMLFVSSVDSASIFFEEPGTPKFEKGKVLAGSSFQRDANQPVTIAVRAIDVTTGDLHWETKLASGGQELRGEFSGLLSTEGGLIFVGYDKVFFALDADTGKKIWNLPVGGEIHAPPVTYSLDGQQYISMIAGRTLFTFALLPSSGKSSDTSAASAKPLPHTP